VTHEEAVPLLRPIGYTQGEVWADLGAGQGRFTLALADLLGEGGVVHAIDKNKRDLQTLEPSQPSFASVRVLERDFTKPLGLDELDGILMANSLHYVRNQVRLLGQLMLQIKEGGKLVIIEYETQRANPWIPFPVSFKRLEELAAKVGLPAPQQVHTRASSFGRKMYVAVITIPHTLRD